MTVLDVKARHRPWSREWRVLYAMRYGEMPLRAWWRRMTACPDCHGTGVIMTGSCTCGSNGRWQHEHDCDEARCPWLCRDILDRMTAERIWSWWLA